MSRVKHAVRITVVVGGLGTAMIAPATGVAQNQGPTPRPFSIAAKRYRFEPVRIEVFQDDLVAIDLRTEDIAHSFTIDEYRIAKRVSPGRPVAFEFRADKPGTFPFYCNLLTEDGCRQMRGELVVKPRTRTQGTENTRR
jgi:heme/copper-type cytochrome/quinol oxidase subunit 2